jgi:hypothetical protein
MPYPQPPVLAGSTDIELRIRTYCRGQLGENVYYYINPPASPSEFIYPALQAWLAAAVPAYQALMNNTAFTQDATLNTWDTAFTRGLTYFSQPNIAFGIAGASIAPTQVSGLITRRVLSSVKRRTGRVYIPFPSTADISSGEVPASTYTAALVNLQQILMPLNAPYITPDGNEWWPASRSSKDGVFRPLIDCRMHHLWATQRRRGDYGTPNRRDS